MVKSHLVLFNPGAVILPEFNNHGYHRRGHRKPSMASLNEYNVRASTNLLMILIGGKGAHNQPIGP